VVDKNNTSGFAEIPGQVPMVAIYTGHIEGVNQSQHLAYSNDNGITWKKYNKNPVLDLGSKEFRDPQVFWYEPEKKWVMTVVLAIDKKIQFYSSDNLKQWNLMSSFGPAGDTSGVWECPDLFEVPVKDQPGKTKWVLMHSPSPYMQYFVGDFDGVSFKNENPAEKIYRPDYGSDYYAAVVYKNLPADSSPISIGWVNNWKYAQDIPTSPWRSMMSLPRTLSVKKINDEWVLIQEPVKTIRTLHLKPTVQSKNLVIEKLKQLPVQSQQFEMEIIISPSANSLFTINLASDKNQEYTVGYDAKTEIVFMDRGHSGESLFNDEYKKLSHFETTLALKNNQVKLHLFFDNSVVELFANDGEAAMTMQIFPANKNAGVFLNSIGGKTIVKEITLWPLKSVW
jgi:fructan beta-fructosidase